MPLSLKPGVTLYFCRHGETEANVERRFQGQSRDTALTAKGRAQAQTIAETLRREAPYFAGLSFVCSPLQRAVSTMEIIHKSLDLAPDGYAIDDSIIEMNLGVWEGLTAAEARDRDPEAYDRRAIDKWNVPIPSGESYSDIAGRASRWIAGLNADAFAVSHGGFTRILRGLIQELTWQAMSDLDEPQGVLFRLRGDDIERLGQPPA